MQAEAAAPVTPRVKKSKVSATVPDYLIYEMDEGRLIYYRGYKEVIKKAKTPEEIMGCSLIQSLLATLISYFARDHFPKNYICLSNELGLKLPKKSRRNLDLAIYDKNKFTEPGKKWSISNWSDDLEMMPGIVLNIEKLLAEV